ncbi:AMP-binding enzyme [Carpediemonas membranifera]|uniref:AMP-binding enzyme n=1 Tax=Carpediemonas membranifera TaxID=201153 RepID=A0A8J6DZK5_9EUKA|nr:AMP-binding enzyme [Carpediemonas membranifera]|eukprot:KAG9393744.1 AMP-binding enzyme [Carpediemonas membranifera]
MSDENVQSAQNGMISVEIPEKTTVDAVETTDKKEPSDFVFDFHPLGLAGKKSEFELTPRTIQWNKENRWAQYTPLRSFRESVELYAERCMLGARVQTDVNRYGDYKWLTYAEVATYVDEMRDFLRSTSLEPGDRVVIYGRNRIEWLIADLACMAAGLVTVPLYDALGVDNLMYICELTDVKAAFVDKRHAPLILSLVDVVPTLELVISMDPFDPGMLLASTGALFCERHNIDLRRKDDSSIYNWDDCKSELSSFAPPTPSIISALDYGSVLIPPNMARFSTVKDAMCPYPAKGPVAIEWNVALTRGKAASSSGDFDMKPDDDFTIIFSSGTTDRPKGVPCRCGALVPPILIASGNVGLGNNHGSPVGEPQHDVILSYLPLAHVFQRSVEHMCIWRGDAIGYYSGNIKMVMGDMAKLKPTYLIAVPRVLMRVYNAMQAKIAQASGVKKYLLNRYLTQRSGQVDSEFEFRKYIKPSPLGNKLVFSKFKATLGGRVRQLWLGSAPMDSKALRFLKVALCVDEVFEGYGLTESMCVGVSNIRYESNLGYLCHQVPGMEFKLASVPGRYDANPAQEHPKGEVCLKGAAVIRQYYKRPDLTEEQIDDDGWFHTGDVAEVTYVDGQPKARLVGRLKNVVKLQQGEFVRLDAIDQAFECGECPSLITVARSTEPYVVVICTVDISQCKASGLLPEDGDEATVQGAEFKKALIQHFRTLGEGKLKPFEFPRNVHVTPFEWTPENKLMTPSMKTVRTEFMSQFSDELDEMYHAPLV